MNILQVTQTGSAVPLSAVPIQARVLIIQNNAAAVARVGDSTVTASKGISLASGGGANSILYVESPVASVNLQQYYTVGTATQVLDVMYEI